LTEYILLNDINTLKYGTSAFNVVD